MKKYLATMTAGVLVSSMVLAGNYQTHNQKQTTITGEPNEQTNYRRSGMSQSKMMESEFPTKVVLNAEKALSQAGYSIDKIDGKVEAKTRDAISKFQAQKNLAVTGRLDKNTLDELDVSYESAMENKKKTQDYSE